MYQKQFERVAKFDWIPLNYCLLLYLQGRNAFD